MKGETVSLDMYVKLNKNSTSLKIFISLYVVTGIITKVIRCH